jgi:hypothetical protein
MAPGGAEREVPRNKPAACWKRFVRRSGAIEPHCTAPPKILSRMCSSTAFTTTHYRGGTPRRRGATHKASSTAQPRQGRGLTATSMRIAALLSTAWAAPLEPGARPQGGGGGSCTRALAVYKPRPTKKPWHLISWGYVFILKFSGLVSIPHPRGAVDRKADEIFFCYIVCTGLSTGMSRQNIFGIRNIRNIADVTPRAFAPVGAPRRPESPPR